MQNICIWFIALLILFLTVSGCKPGKESAKELQIKKIVKIVEATPVENESFTQLIDSLYNLSNKIGYKEGVAKSLSFKANYFSSKGQTEEALKKYQEAIKVSLQTKNLLQLGDDYNNIGRMYFRLKEREKAIAAFKDAVEIRIKSKDSSGLGSSLNNIGFLFWQVSDYDSAVYYFEKALEIRNKLHNKEYSATTYNNLGTVFFNWSLYDKALDHYLHSFELQREIGNNNGIALSLCNIGLVYKETAQNEKAIEYYRESLPYAFAANSSQTVGYAYSCFGAAYSTLNKDSSLYYFRKSLAAYKEVKNNDGEILALQGIGNYYLDLKEIKSAKIYFTEMLTLAFKENISMRIAEAYKNLGEIALLENHLEKAQDYFKKSIAIGEKSSLKVILKDSYSSLSTIYEKRGKIGEALIALKAYNDYRQQIENEGMQKRLTDLKNKSEYEKYQRNLQTQKYENEKQKIYLIVTITAIIFLFVVAVVLFRMNNRRKKVNLLLHEKNRLIEGQSKEINLKNVELLELNEAKEKLFSIIAHDLRSPFNTLINIVTVLKEDFEILTDEEKMDYISHLEETAIKTYELVENLLNLSVSHTGRLAYNPARLEIAEVVDKIIYMSKTQAAKKEIQITNKIDKEVTAVADQSMLEIIIRNLVNNAIKYCNVGGRVEVASYEDGEKLNISVEDNGIGMDEATTAHIFNINVIRSKKGTSGEKGTGLGLGLCKEFVEKNGGKIWVESEVSKGSKFIFTLPKEV
ncbi:MAG: tetratricopeptide repeat protein [Ignavibacteria bacterium]|nr:tetratricopeptide repeat protein [Ignavibacteria bacterium]